MDASGQLHLPVPSNQRHDLAQVQIYRNTKVRRCEKVFRLRQRCDDVKPRKDLSQLIIFVISSIKALFSVISANIYTKICMRYVITT